MDNFNLPGPVPAPQPNVVKINRETVQPEFDNHFQSLTFSENLTTAFKLTLRQFIYYLLPLFTYMVISLITLGLLWTTITVGMCTAVLRQIDGDERRITFSEMFAPLNRLGVMLILVLIFWGLSIVNMVFIFTLSVLGAIPVLGVIFTFLSMSCQIIISFSLGLIMSISCFYLAEYDDTAVNAISTAFKMLKNNIVRWLSAMLCVLIIYMPLSFLTIGLLLLSILPSIRFNDEFNIQFTTYTVIMLIISFLSLLAVSLFLTVYSYFVYGLTYRQCTASETSNADNAPV